MLLRALDRDASTTRTRSPRSLTIHYARAPEPGPVSDPHGDRARGALAEHAVGAHGAGRRADRARARGVLGAVERAGGRRAADARGRAAGPRARAGRRCSSTARRRSRATWCMPAAHRRASRSPARRSRWKSAAGSACAEPRPIDALSLAFFSDALFPPPFMRLTRAGDRADDRPHDPLPRADAARGASPIPTSCASRAFARA